MKKQQYRDLVFPLIIVVLNFIIVFPWFGDGYPSSASIEPIVITQAQFIRDNWPHLSWFPNWYLGYPYRLAGSPLLPVLIALINFICPDWSFWFVYRLITGLALIVLPLGFYFLARSLTKKDNWLAV
ncbi:MAG: hypothetical protein PHF74_08330, partial [Dehalococcoidales bacterium]|nr:hypothetical protein [Dehalococcoidales bacterium]